MNRREFIGSSALACLLSPGTRAHAQVLPRAQDLNFRRWRRRLVDVPADIQAVLAQAILDYSQGVASQHHLYNGAHGVGTRLGDPGDTPIVGHGVPRGRGRTFFTWHRAYLVGLEQRLATIPDGRPGGGRLFLPSWAPWEPIPTAFRRRISDHPVAVGKAPFALFSDDVIGHQADEDMLGVSLSNGPHFAVHALTGGDMAVPDRAARAPIFWPWHAFVDDLHRTWADRRKRYGDRQPMPKYFPFDWASPSGGGGVQARRTNVPFCIGKTINETRQALQTAGLSLGNVSGDANHRVFTQNPLPFVSVGRGGRVDVSTKLPDVSDAADALWPPW